MAILKKWNLCLRKKGTPRGGWFRLPKRRRGKFPRRMNLLLYNYIGRKFHFRILGWLMH
jgi:hypothetical protein